MDNRLASHASSLVLYAVFVATAAGCSAQKPHVAFAVKESSIASVLGDPLTPDAPKTEAPPEPKADRTEAPARNIDDLLATCREDGKSKTCVLAASDAEELCRAMSPTNALHVFANNKKMRVGFLTRDMEAWSTSHIHSTKSLARFDEEVIVLAKRTSKSGIVVSGASVTYEVLRWNGSCASLMGDEITFRRAPRPVRPLKVEQLYLPIREKLLDDQRIHAAYDRADTVCRGDENTVACDIARRSFGDAVMKRGPRLGL